MNDITTVLCTKDNPLVTITLTSLISQTLKPDKLLIIDEGDQAIVRRVEVQKIIDILTLSGVEVNIIRHLPSEGISRVRLFSMSRVTTKYAHCIDDDIWMDNNALERLYETIIEKEAGFVGACKAELNNDRGYKDFTLTPRKEETNPRPVYYYKEDFTVQVSECDGGHMLVDMNKYRDSGCFKILEEYDKYANMTPGSDGAVTVLLGYKYPSYFRSGALSWHMGTSVYRFSSGTLRNNYLVEKLQKFGVPKEYMVGKLRWK